MSHAKVTPSGLVTESERLAASKLGGDIEYDAAGRVIADASRGITSIEYNSDSHPTKIKFGGLGTQTLVWDNMGNHISTTYMTLNSSLVRSNQSVDELNITDKPYYFTETSRRYYGSGQIAVDDSLVMTRFPGGYLTGDGKARYYFTDYQGNNLATIDADGKIVESTGYYPYGLPWEEPTENPYLYGDKEYDNVHGLGEYYYGARQSVPVLAGGFTTIDPLCEKRPGESPYILCGANPIRNVDPDGTIFHVAVGAVIGAVISAGIETISQLNSDEFSYSAITGAAVQGAVTGAVAVATAGFGIGISAGAMAASNATGGVARDLIQGTEPTVESVATDATVGALSSVAGAGLKQGLNMMSNASKGNLGELCTKVKYTTKGYHEVGRHVEVETGRTTPKLHKPEVAKYDFKFEHVLSKKTIIVESKYNTSGLTKNQRLAKDKVNLITDRTTSDDFSAVIQILTAAGLSKIDIPSK